MLNASGRFSDYLGPVNWDISAEDFAFWRRGAPADEAAAAYLQLIEETGRGIVLMHDSSEEDLVRSNNQTLELTMLLVPELRRRGYRFVPLTEIPQVQVLLRAGSACAGGKDKLSPVPAKAASLAAPTALSIPAQPQ